MTKCLSLRHYFLRAAAYSLCNNLLAERYRGVFWLVSRETFIKDYSSLSVTIKNMLDGASR